MLQRTQCFCAIITLAVILCLSAIHAPARAQQPAPKSKKPTGKTTPVASKNAGEPDPLAAMRRATAISNVNSLADEARNFHDPVLRARVQARVADVLWVTDRARARALFRRAWEAAEAADKEQGEQRARDAARRGAASSREAGSVRREVIRLAARRERVLGDEFLALLEESNTQSATDAAAAATSSNSAAGQPFDPDDPPSIMTQRLNLARQLLEDGEVEKAMQFADPALYPVNTFGMNVLDVLREKDAAAADRRYLSLVSRANADSSADANTVSLLASYVFTPNLYVTVRPDGNSHTRRWSPKNTPPSTLSPDLRNAFFRTAASILLRPTLPPDQDRSSAGRAGTYIVLMRLTPLFEKYGVSEAPALRARIASLMQDTPERLHHPNDPLYTRGIVPEDPNKDRVQEMLDRLDNAKTDEERDQIYFQAAMGAADHDIERAKEMTDKIADADLRQQLRAFLDFNVVRAAIKNKKPDQALRLARAGQLTNVQRAWALTEVARLLAKTEPGRAAEVLDEAGAEARRIDQNSPDRVRVLVAIVTQLQAIDRGRAWELMNEVVKASNSTTEFSGEDGGLTIRVGFKGGRAMTSNFGVESFDLSGIFDVLAREDFNRASDLARSLTGENARSVASLSVARTALEKKTAKN